MSLVFGAQCQGVGLAYPTNYQTTNGQNHWAKLSAKEMPNHITITIFNRKDWTPIKLVVTQPHIHTTTAIPSNALQYALEPQWPPYYNQPEPTLTTIICVHSLEPPPQGQIFALQFQHTTQRPP